MPPTPTPSWTQADLDSINAAIASGSNRVKFADREVQYQSLTELLKVKNLIAAYLGQGGKVQRRQIRMVTGTGW